MELIYLNNQLVEQGIITDFTLDYAYGKDENDFEIRTPENEMYQGYYWYIKDTEYGGKIDEIQCESNSKEVVYKGRTWQGLLNSYSGLQIEPIHHEDGIAIEQNGDYLNFQGSVKDILQYILDGLNLNITITDDTITDDINASVQANQLLYFLLTDLCTQIKCKVRLRYDNGIQIGIVGAIDFTQDEYFDTSQYTIVYNSNAKIPNHLIGKYQKDDKVVIKHIYTDSQGNIQPYYDLDEAEFDYTMDGVHYTFELHHDKPLHNGEYERATGVKQIDGLNEVVEVVEGGSTIENYDMVTTYNTEFDGEVPIDWNEHYYENYYIKKYNDNQEPTYELVEKVINYEEFSPSSSITQNEWRRVWGEYYKRSDEPDEHGNYTYTQLTDADITDNVTYYETTPYLPTWSNDYTTYFWREYVNNEWVYHNVEGIAYEEPVKQNKSPVPSDWQNNTNRGHYYFYWTHYKWLVHIQVKRNGKWVDGQIPTQQVSTGTAQTTSSKAKVYVKGSLNNFKALGSLTLWDLLKRKYDGIKSDFTSTKTVNASSTVRYKVHPRVVDYTEYISVSDYCSRTGKKASQMKWTDHTYYLNVTKYRVPDWNYYPEGDHKYYFMSHSYDAPDYSKTYYKQVIGIEPFKKGYYYRKVIDDYTNLCEAMLKKLDDIKTQAQKIEPKLDTDIIEFDVGDIIGGVHPFTKEPMISKVTKKIVKGGTFGVNVNYEIG